MRSHIHVFSTTYPSQINVLMPKGFAPPWDSTPSRPSRRPEFQAPLCKCKAVVVPNKNFNWRSNCNCNWGYLTANFDGVQKQLTTCRNLLGENIKPLKRRLYCISVVQADNPSGPFDQGGGLKSVEQRIIKVGSCMSLVSCHGAK